MICAIWQLKKSICVLWQYWNIAKYVHTRTLNKVQNKTLWFWLCCIIIMVCLCGMCNSWNSLEVKIRIILISQKFIYSHAHWKTKSTLTQFEVNRATRDSQFQERKLFVLIKWYFLKTLLHIPQSSKVRPKWNFFAVTASRIDQSYIQNLQKVTSVQIQHLVQL